jgi:hypothetical protein
MREKETVPNVQTQTGQAMKPPTEQPLYISPKQLASRWACARSSVDRIAKRAGLTRVCLGTGKNGIVRFLLEEVETLESERQVNTSPALL